MNLLGYQWPLLQHTLRKADQMDRVFDRLGIDPAVAVRMDGGLAFRAARTRCLSCSRSETCAGDPGCATGGSGACLVLPEHCRNADFFRACLARMQRRMTQ